jgi:uncharacterized protein YndB with AHSA1/START domain
MANKKAKKSPVKKPAKKAAKKAAKKVVKKSPVKKPAKKAPKKASKKIQKKAPKKAATKTAKKATKKAPAKKAAKKAVKPSSKKAPPEKTTKKLPKVELLSAMIVQHVFVPASPDAVYRSLTDPTLHTAFTGTACSGNPVVGGTFLAGGGYIHGKYVELLPAQHVVAEWKTTEWPHGAPPSRVDIRLVPSSAGPAHGCELTLTHSDVPLHQAEMYRQGWIDSYWQPLRRSFEQSA